MPLQQQVVCLNPILVFFWKEDNAGPGCAQKCSQKLPLVWMTWGSHFILQVSRVSSRTSPGPFLAEPRCWRQPVPTVAAVSPGMGGLGNKKQPLLMGQSLPCCFPVSYPDWSDMFKDAGALSCTGVVQWGLWSHWLTNKRLMNCTEMIFALNTSPSHCTRAGFSLLLLLQQSPQGPAVKNEDGEVDLLPMQFKSIKYWYQLHSWKRNQTSAGFLNLIEFK